MKEGRERKKEGKRERKKEGKERKKEREKERRKERKKEGKKERKKERMPKWERHIRKANRYSMDSWRKKNGETWKLIVLTQIMKY